MSYRAEIAFGQGTRYARVMVPESSGGDGVVADLVYDVGAHLGEDTDFYLRLGYRVVAVEAHPGHVAHLKQRFTHEIAGGRLVVIDKAIASGSGRIPFYVSDANPAWSTTDSEWAARNAQVGAGSAEIEVDATPLAAIIERHGIPCYAKIDIEGADQACLEDLAGFPSRPPYVSVEAPTNKWAQVVAQIDALGSLGYRRFQVVRQGRHVGRRFVSRSGQPFSHSFGLHSSGPFGDLLQGAWLTRKQALRRYRWHSLAERLFNQRAPLGRILVTLPGLRRIPASVGWYDTHAAF